MQTIPRLAFTPGEPAGIGPDLAIMLAQSALDCELVCYSNRALLEARAATLKLPLHLIDYDAAAPRTANTPHTLKLIEHPLAAPVDAGILNPENASFVLQTIQAAAKACLDGTMDGLVTGPIHKGIINQAGIPFSGHTEFLQQLAQKNKVVMMLANDKMRVALATTHLPLSEVSGAISHDLLLEVLTILQHSLQQDFGITHPHILVTGLNPHAGESGHMGMEEINIIEPALQYCRENLHLTITGPLPADTLFTEKYLETADAVLAMYHDQGLPVLKYAGFGTSVNITLGLPFIRTSVDHGTALDLAGTGKALDTSLKTAIHYAITMAENHANHAYAT